jgi:CRISPR-associated exonuclease Cas4
VETVLISQLEHWSYCPRQCGLIHLESVWDENVFTIRGTHLHERADTAMVRQEKGRTVERALPIWSDRLGLRGRADIVEFDRDGRPTPVEYKSGKAKSDRHASVQLCAEALCLEEMFGLKVPQGAIFFAESRQRQEVVLDGKLRAKTIEVIEQVREMLCRADLPKAKYDAKCRNCSLIDACVPQALTRSYGVAQAALFTPWTEAEIQ